VFTVVEDGMTATVTGAQKESLATEKSGKRDSDSAVVMKHVLKT
jgi:hypothetical protein